MQKIILYLRADSVKATVVDKYNQGSSVPALARGMAAAMTMRLVDSDGVKYDPALLDFAAWDFVLENDWDVDTPVKLRATTITLNVSNDYTEVEAVFDNTNTDALITALGANESISLGAELVGFKAGETLPEFILQFDGVTIRNRRSEAGTASPVTMEDNYYTAQQTDALVRAAPEFQFSVDGVADPHSVRVYTDRFYRERRNGGEWSIWIAFPDNSSGLLAHSFTNDDLAGGILTITHDMGDVVLPGMITNNNGKNETIDSKNITFGNNQILVDLNILSPLTGTWRYAFGGLPGATGPASTVPGPAGVQGVSTRYAKGNISGAVAIDRANGDYQVCTTTAAVTGITISNLATETGMILRINNAGGYAVTWGTTEIIAATDTGSYACAFYNDNGTVCYMGKSEIR
ncbi:MAG: hypothetical protein WCI51_02330 [Lentisphaerota bacterium]